MSHLDPQRTALLLVDLQSRIVSLPVRPRAGDAVVATARELVGGFRKAGATVALVEVRRPDVADQPPGSELVTGLAEEGDIRAVKPGISGFHGTELHQRLQDRGIDTLVLGGIATNLGVESTARSARDLGYRLIFVEDAMAALTTAEHSLSVAHNFPRLGEVATAAEVLDRF